MVAYQTQAVHGNALAAFFFWPLVVGMLLGLHGPWLWVMAGVFFAGGLSAAWPRAQDR